MKTKGFTFIDTLVGISLMLIVFLGIFGAYQLGIKVVGQSRNKITATAIANQKIEMIRNLPYGSVGVIGKFPAGVLKETTTTLINNIEYTIETRVDYVVDSADGIAAPEDDCPHDYKRVEVKVSWRGLFPGEVKLSTDIAPKNLVEECATGGGILSVSVFDAYGLMVSSPLIEVKDPVTDKTLKTATPKQGKHYFSLPPATYKVVVSKSGFSIDRSYGTDEVTTPKKPHPIVLEGQLTEVSFSIDKVSSFSVNTLSPWISSEAIPIPNATFNLRGAKIIGTDTDEKPVYKYSQDHTTDATGRINIPNLEWDNYTFSIDPATGLDLVDTVPSPQPISLFPNTTLSVILYLKAENSLLVTVRDVETLEPVFSAAVRLYNVGLGYDTTQHTNEKGQTYFIPLAVASYNLEIQASGYSSFAGTVSVSGDNTIMVELELKE